MPLSIFDLDRTLLRINSSFSYYSHLHGQNIFPSHSVFFSILYFLRYKYFRWPPKQLHQQVFKKFLEGRKKSDIIGDIDVFLEKYLENSFYLPALDCFRKAKEENHHIVLLSNTPEFLVAPFAKMLQVDEYKGTEYGYDQNDHFSSIKSIMDGEQKALYTTLKAKEMQIDKEAMTAYSDSFWDLPLLESVGNAIVVNPDRKLKSIAEKRNWKII